MRDEVAHQKIDALYKNYTLRQDEIEIQLQEVHNLTETHNKTTEKLNKLISSLDKVEKVQQTMQKKLHIQEKAIENLDNLTNTLEQVTREQQTMKKKLEQLADQLQQLLKSQDVSPVTQIIPSSSGCCITTPLTTEKPNSGWQIIRKHAHAKGTNIVITV